MVNQVAERYGEALFALALEMNTLESWQKQAKSVIKVFNSNPELKAFFRAVKISTEEKKSFIKNIFSQNLDKMLVNFICLLIDKKRIENVVDIFEYFNYLGNEERGIINGVVYSVRLLSDEDMNKIENAMTQRYNRKVELANKVDTRLISGIKVKVGNEVIDGSMKTKIEALKQELLKESR